VPPTYSQKMADIDRCRKAPTGSAGRGVGAGSVFVRFGLGLTRWRRQLSSSANRLEKIEERREIVLAKRTTAYLVLLTSPTNQHHPSTHAATGHCRPSRHRQEMRRSSASPSCQFHGRANQPDIEPTPIFAKSPCTCRPEPRSPTSSSMALVGRGWLRLLPPCCNGDPQTFFPCFAFLAHQETSRPAVLHCVSALRVQRMQAPACHQPSRPRISAGFDQHEGN
jgi:hypothetical protein